MNTLKSVFNPNFFFIRISNNLISFKQYSRLEYSKIGKYIAEFTAINVAFLIPLTAVALLLS